MSFKLTSIFDVIFHWHINSISISQRIVHNLKIGTGSLLLLSISFVSVLSKVSFMVKTQVLSLISHLSAEVYGIKSVLTWDQSNLTEWYFILSLQNLHSINYIIIQIEWACHFDFTPHPAWIQLYTWEDVLKLNYPFQGLACSLSSRNWWLFNLHYL